MIPLVSQDCPDRCNKSTKYPVDVLVINSRPRASKPKLKLAKRKGGFTATLTTGAAGKATVTVTRNAKRVAKKIVTVGKSGKATVTFKVRGKLTVKATFAGQTVSAKLRA